MCASTNDEKMEKEKRPIDNRLVLNKKTLNAHGAQKEETAGIIDSRIRVRIREVPLTAESECAFERCGSSLECTRTDAKMDNAWVSMGS